MIEKTEVICLRVYTGNEQLGSVEPMTRMRDVILA
jgi:hypothetical protein